MSIFMGGLLFALGIEIGVLATAFFIARPLQNSQTAWRKLAMESTELNLDLLTKLYAKQTITTETTPVFRSESKESKKPAKVQRGDAGSVR